MPNSDPALWSCFLMEITRPTLAIESLIPEWKQAFPLHIWPTFKPWQQNRTQEMAWQMEHFINPQIPAIYRLFSQSESKGNQSIVNTQRWLAKKYLGMQSHWLIFGRMDDILRGNIIERAMYKAKFTTTYFLWRVRHKEKREERGRFPAQLVETPFLNQFKDSYHDVHGSLLYKRMSPEADLY